MAPDVFLMSRREGALGCWTPCGAGALCHLPAPPVSAQHRELGSATAVVGGNQPAHKYFLQEPQQLQVLGYLIVKSYLNLGVELGAYQLCNGDVWSTEQFVSYPSYTMDSELEIDQFVYGNVALGFSSQAAAVPRCGARGPNNRPDWTLPVVHHRPLFGGGSGRI